MSVVAVCWLTCGIMHLPPGRQACPQWLSSHEPNCEERSAYMLASGYDYYSNEVRDVVEVFTLSFISSLLHLTGCVSHWNC